MPFMMRISKGSEKKGLCVNVNIYEKLLLKSGLFRLFQARGSQMKTMQMLYENQLFVDENQDL